LIRSSSRVQVTGQPLVLVWLDDLSRLFDLEALVWAKRERLGSSNTLMS
jgi:hypothetical protein